MGFEPPTEASLEAGQERSSLRIFFWALFPTPLVAS